MGARQLRRRSARSQTVQQYCALYTVSAAILCTLDSVSKASTHVCGAASDAAAGQAPIRPCLLQATTRHVFEGMRPRTPGPMRSTRRGVEGMRPRRVEPIRPAVLEAMTPRLLEATTPHVLESRTCGVVSRPRCRVCKRAFEIAVGLRGGCRESTDGPPATARVPLVIVLVLVLALVLVLSQGVGRRFCERCLMWVRSVGKSTGEAVVCRIN